MIHKYYEVICDYCGDTIDHYPERKPSNNVLFKDGIIHSKTKQFCCRDCYVNWKTHRYDK